MHHSSYRPQIGLLGGSFNPPHWAHIQLAKAALTQLNLTRVDLMPAGQPWYKTIETNPMHRLALCNLAVAYLNQDAALSTKLDHLNRFSVERCEIDRVGTTYTIDTLNYLTANNPNQDYTLIIGADQANQLDTWHQWQDLLTRCQLAVVARGIQAVQLPPSVLRAFPALHTVNILNMPPLTLSSTLIRTKLAQKQSIADAVPPSIAKYIQDHQLYQNCSS